MPSFRPILVTLFSAVLLACGGPLVMIPGGALSGTVSAAPTDWAFTDAVDTLQLETRPADPYSVNVWAVAVGERLFIACGDRENRWGTYIQDDPNVRVRVGETLYELRAELLSGDEDRAAVLAAMKKKYEFEPSPEQQGQALLFALSPRA